MYRVVNAPKLTDWLAVQPKLQTLYHNIEWPRVHCIIICLDQETRYLDWTFALVRQQSLASASFAVYLLIILPSDTIYSEILTVYLNTLQINKIKMHLTTQALVFELYGCPRIIPFICTFPQVKQLVCMSTCHWFQWWVDSPFAQPMSWVLIYEDLWQPWLPI